MAENNTPRRMLLGDYTPPPKVSAAELPEEDQVRTRTYTDHNERAKACGIRYQRCGGGRRVLRKQIGVA